MAAENFVFVSLVNVNVNIILLALPSGLFRDNLQHWLGDFLPDCLRCSLQVMKE